MQRATQIEILKELLRRLDNNITCDAGKVLMNPTSSYTDEALAKQEREAFFANHPQVLGLSGELPKPGSYLTTNDFGIPILATRDASGRFRAFVNACRHRGAHVAVEPRGEQSRFVCPFHGWTFRNDGKLIGVRNQEQFGNIDKACHNLIELPSAEKYGLLVVHPKLDGVLDVDAVVGDLAPELAAWGFDRAEFHGESVLDMPVNWKIANDTFGEVYHFSSLHKNTLANLLYGDIAMYDEYGRNHRICLASKYITAMREQPEDNWSVTDGAIVAYYLFPNVQLVILNRMIALARIYPDAKQVGKSLTRVSHYAIPHVAAHVVDSGSVQKLTASNVYHADTSARIEFNLEASAELFVSTVEHEDYFMGTKSQQAASSGLVDYFLFGRNEPALHHFHNNYRTALGQPPLTEYHR
jgi:phenylpropionate dioxygenase-like ring-hydroxylating dioxygenase large terminal subunit